MTQSLTSRCYRDVPDADRGRGHAYQRTRRVRLGKITAGRLDARVTGSDTYTVTIDWQEADAGRLRVRCECPRFSDAGVCKHVWAVILEIDEAGYSDLVPGNGSLRLIVLDEPFEPLEEEDRRPWGAPAPRQHQSPWRRQLSTVRDALRPREMALSRGLGGDVETWFVADLAATRTRGSLVVGFFQRRRKRSREWGKLKPSAVDAEQLRQLPAGEERALIELLRAVPYSPWFFGAGGVDRVQAGVVNPAMQEHLLPRLAATGRFLWSPGPGAPLDLTKRWSWDPGEPWRFRLVAERAGEQGGLRLRGEIHRAEESVPLAAPLLLTAGGLVLFPTTIARLDAEADFPWILLLREAKELTVPAGEEGEAVAALWGLPSLPAIVGDLDLQLREERHVPRPRLVLRKAAGQPRILPAEVVFSYDNLEASFLDHRPALLDPANKRRVPRDREAEIEAMTLFAELPFTSTTGDHRRGMGVAEKDLPQVVDRLLGAGWKVEAEGAPLRRAEGLRFSVSSGIDWLDLALAADFGGIAAPPEELLAALARRERFVDLGDGSFGMLPQAWLDRFGSLAKLSGEADATGLRFAPSQALLLDALLADAPLVDLDAAFQGLRRRLLAGTELEPAAQPAGFRGELRPYQRLGLAWLGFLGEVGFGGCLADDMGLGKTVQVLALLQARKAAEAAEHAATNGGERRERRPSLVVAPRSVVYNWLDEAARFAPALRSMEYGGGERADLRARFAEHDLVVVTYGVVRRDALHLRAIPFEHVIFDEAQAVKNPATQAYKACRLLQARHRLALSGTPVENHLGELWALLELLNPGLLGRLPASRGTTRGADLSDGELAAVSRAVRPFLLRRTKEQVLAELPPKTEQTLLCTLEGAQRRLYDELRRHYQASLSERVAAVGLGRAKILVLEALLRLRQAACHPGLVIADRAGEPSAKLETLLAQLEELGAEGHKAIVFSQFTKLLGLVRLRLADAGIPCEYLDGRTVDRKAKVERFQNDPHCPVFLVSLKAGGLGLNLTAASYVFLLDPWWNPAVEAQAIDRAHRIGQGRAVFAYRLIARDTVEEKILELQRRKRRVADAILATDASLLQSLSVDDLNLLLS
jgi:SNF2 domain-containing protein/helicase-like protein/SWIM zinc finger